MYSQCPECLTVYSVDTEILGAGHGMVRCGHCNAVFDTLRTLNQHLPPEPFERMPAHVPAAHPPQLSVPSYRPNAAQAPLVFDPDEQRPAKPRERAAAHQTPQFARRGSALRAPPRRWPWVVGSLVLFLSLSAQIAYAERDLLLNQAQLRPWLDTACESLHCRLPPRHDIAQLQLVSRDIRPHPSVKGALIISATLRNDADFAQAYPVLEITLSDLDENRIAMRRFQPRDYVGDARVLSQGLMAGASTAVVVEVQDPGKNAVAFEFKFL